MPATFSTNSRFHSQNVCTQIVVLLPHNYYFVLKRQSKKGVDNNSASQINKTVVKTQTNITIHTHIELLAMEIGKQELS